MSSRTRPAPGGKASDRWKESVRFDTEDGSRGRRGGACRWPAPGTEAGVRVRRCGRGAFVVCGRLVAAALAPPVWRNRSGRRGGDSRRRSCARLAARAHARDHDRCIRRWRCSHGWHRRDLAQRGSARTTLPPRDHRDRRHASSTVYSRSSASVGVRADVTWTCVASRSISSRVPVPSPRRVTFSAPAAMPRRTASIGVIPRARPTPIAANIESPAPWWSSASNTGAVSSVGSAPSSRNVTGSEPRETTTRREPATCSDCAPRNEVGGPNRSSRARRGSVPPGSA